MSWLTNLTARSEGGGWMLGAPAPSPVTVGALLFLLAACEMVPAVDECRIGATTITPQGGVIIHLDSSVIKDPDKAKFVDWHELYHGLTGSRDEFAADKFAEELTYIGVSPCPAARHLQTCGDKMDNQQLKDRARVLGEGNSCLGFG